MPEPAVISPYPFKETQIKWIWIDGGPTMTHALLPGSVAIDAIPEAQCVDADGEPLATDQRGEPRNSMCDVGAFEVQR